MTNEIETKEIILEKIKNAQPIKGSNSMGVSESFYNPYYLLKDFGELEKLEQMTEKDLQLLLSFAGYVTDVFY